ncbi:MAG: tetratricopeptide repeat protein [Vicinamibacterales bacterium]
MRPALSLCLVVKNEALLLPHALEGMREIADECIVIDTGSTDATREIARAAGAKVFDYAWDGNLGRARNAYIERAAGSWILVLDGDETIAERDRPKIRALIESRDAGAYSLTVHDYSRGFDLLRNWHPNIGEYPDEERRSGCPGRAEFDVVRLFRNAPGVRYDEGASTHTNPIRSLQRLGWAILPSGVVVHHFQWLKGGDRFIAGKQLERLDAERRQADAAPDDCRANVNVGRTLFSLGLDEEALAYLTRAVAADPASAEARFARGLLLSQTDRPDAAAADLREAVALKPDYADAWAVLGISCHAMEQSSEAVTALRRALEHHPAHPVAHNSLGVVHLDAGRLQEAEVHFTRALEILPAHAMAGWNLASLYEQLGDVERARGVCRTALMHCPDDELLKQKLADLSG